MPSVLGIVAVILSSMALDVGAQSTGFEFASDTSEQTVDLDIQSDFSDFDEELGIARARGDVIVKYGGVTIRAEQVEYHQFSGKIFARDNVRVYRNGETIEAEEIIYNVNTGEMTTSQLKSALEPLFYTTDEVIRPEEDSGGPITMLNSDFTTHDSANPSYRFQVKKLEIYPDDKVVMHGAKLYMGKIPVMWFPFYVQPMDDDLGYYFTPGWNSIWGGFLLNRYGFMVGEDIFAKAHLDLRTERGVAGGFEFEAAEFRSNPNIGRLNLYYANDSDPQLAFNGLRRTDPVDPNRYRVNFQHRIYFPGSDDETFYLDFDINKLSDAFVYEDFAPSEFRIDPQPDNLINLTKLFDQGEVSLTGRFAINDFFQTDTRSPELAIDIIRTPLGESGFFYEGLTTYGIIDEEISETSIAAGLIDPPGFNRFQTYHEFLFPTQLAGFLNVTPRAGGGYRNYSNFDIAGIDTFESTTAHAGIDISFKMSKRSPNVVNRKLGLDGLLHVVQPYLNYSLVRTDEINGRFTPIDRFTPTTRLRPIDMPLFTTVDDLRDWQIIRTGISQRWFTKRNGTSHEWLSLNNYLELYPEDPEFGRDTSNFFTEVAWSPLPWLSAQTVAQFPLFDDTLDFTEVTSNLYFMPSDWFRVGFGRYYLNNHPVFQDSDLYTLSTYTRLSDDWGFSTNHRFEADDGTMEYQQYSIHKDLSAWTANLGAIIRDNRIGEKEYGVLFSLTLKAFPRVSLPVDFQPGGLGAEDN